MDRHGFVERLHRLAQERLEVRIEPTHCITLVRRFDPYVRDIH